MNSKDINKILKNCTGYIGTFPVDLLPLNIKKFPVILIVNTDPSYRPGEHWISIYIGANKTGEYFDSYGLPPLHPEIINFLDIMCPRGYNYNPHTLQCISCITCGYYCIIYVIFKSNKKSYCEFISLFSKNVYTNEVKVKNLIKNILK